MQGRSNFDIYVELRCSRHAILFGLEEVLWSNLFTEMTTVRAILSVAFTDVIWLSSRRLLL